jgi:hypothetical protein
LFQLPSHERVAQVLHALNTTLLHRHRCLLREERQADETRWRATSASGQVESLTGLRALSDIRTNLPLTPCGSSQVDMGRPEILCPHPHRRSRGAGDPHVSQDVTCFAAAGGLELVWTRLRTLGSQWFSH